MMRKIIRENIQRLAAGEDYMTLEQTVKVDGVVPTYMQDSVVTIPARDDDRGFMREIGYRVNYEVFAGASLPDDARERRFKKRLQEIWESYI